jgi:hypothetical protein
MSEKYDNLVRNASKRYWSTTCLWFFLYLSSTSSVLTVDLYVLRTVVSFRFLGIGALLKLD